MIHLKTPQEIEVMARSGAIAGEVLEEVLKEVASGVSTLDLDKFAEDKILSLGGEPGFKKVAGYQHTLCTTINEEVVHGIPKGRKLAVGDILSIDLGVFYQGWHSDTAVTVPVGDTSWETRKFLQAGKDALYAGIREAEVGKHVGDISAQVEEILSNPGYGVVESLTGHGVGRELHEEPLIPNMGKKGSGLRLEEGMVIAIEPIYTNGSPEVYLEDDGWTVTSEKATLAGLFEHTIAITKDGPKILTLRPGEVVP